MQELILGITILRYQCALPVWTGQTAHLWSQVAGWVAVTLLSHFCSLGWHLWQSGSSCVKTMLSHSLPSTWALTFRLMSERTILLFQLFGASWYLLSFFLGVSSVSLFTSLVFMSSPSPQCSVTWLFLWDHVHSVFTPTFYKLPFSQSIIFGFLLSSSLYPPLFLKESLGMQPRLASNLQCPSLPSKYWKCCHAWHHLRNLFLCIELLLIA